MKKIALFIISSFITLTLFSQEQAEDHEIKTLFGSGVRISGFGGPFMSFTVINGGFAHMMGGGGGLLLDNFFFGGYGEGLTNYVENMPDGDQIEFGHGGFWTGYSFLGSKPVHPAVSCQIGWGDITLTDSESQETNNEDNVFVITPTIECEMNFFSFFRLSVGANYRFVTGVNSYNLTTWDMSGPGVFLAFKFGGF
jgi:hypothetical protein